MKSSVTSQKYSWPGSEQNQVIQVKDDVGVEDARDGKAWKSSFSIRPKRLMVDWDEEGDEERGHKTRGPGEAPSCSREFTPTVSRSAWELERE